MMRNSVEWWQRRFRVLSMSFAALIMSTFGLGHASTQSYHGDGQNQTGVDIEVSRGVPLAPGYSSLGFDLPEAGSYRLPAIKKASTGRVLLETGEPTELTELFGGRYVILSFIYSSCDDVNGCPLATFVMYQIYQRIQEDEALAKQLQLMTLSFDPDNDSPEVMSLYRRTFTGSESNWRFLTTESESALMPILDGYGQSVNKSFDENGQPTGHYSHILRVFLIDTEQQIRNIYNVDFLHPDLLLTDLRTLILEDTNSNGRMPDDESRQPLSQPWGELLVKNAKMPPLGLPPLPKGGMAGLTAEKVDLGRKLFRDRRLSSNGALSCSSCHNPQTGFTQNSMGRAIGIEGKSLRRNTSSLLNTGYQSRLFWDGREFALDTLIWGKVLDEIALGNRSTGEVLKRLRDDDELQAEFQRAFKGKGITLETVASALSTYIMTLVSGDSRFDRWYFGDDRHALSDKEKEGFELFSGRAGCASCHKIGTDHALFMDNDLHNTGLGWEHSMGLRTGRAIVIEVAGQTIKVNSEALAGTEARRHNDLGLYEVTQHPDDRWRFRTPTLRDVELTSPYMHDGSISTLEDVVEFYNKGGVPHAFQAEAIRPLELDSGEEAALVAFLKTLTGRYIDVQP